MTTFVLPDLGEGLQEAEIVSWHVEPGDRVVADQPLVSVETDKAVVEVPAPYAGTLMTLHAQDGDVVAVGAPLADFDSDEKREDSGVIVGKLETEGNYILKSLLVDSPPDSALISPRRTKGQTLQGLAPWLRWLAKANSGSDRKLMVASAGLRFKMEAVMAKSKGRKLKPVVVRRHRRSRPTKRPSRKC